jgi:hypothetical protein
VGEKRQHGGVSDLSYTVNAFNTATESANKIHDDAVARNLGFRGGLVPGVDVEVLRFIGVDSIVENEQEADARRDCDQKSKGGGRWFSPDVHEHITRASTAPFLALLRLLRSHRSNHCVDTVIAPDASGSQTTGTSFKIGE